LGDVTLDPREQAHGYESEQRVRATRSQGEAPEVRSANTPRRLPWVISGVVRDATGGGLVTHAKITAMDDGSHWRWEANTAKDGTFRIDLERVRELTPFARRSLLFTLVAQAAGFQRGFRRFALPWESEDRFRWNLELELERGAIIHGRVLYAPGGGASGVTVRLRRRGQDEQKDQLADTDKDGKYLFDVGTRGDYRVKLDRPRQGVGPDGVEVVVRAFESIEARDLYVGGQSIGGRLFFGDGSPLARTEVILDDLASWRTLSVMSDVHGGFDFRGLLPGKYEVVVYGFFDNYSSGPLRPGGDRHEFRIDNSCLKAEVVDRLGWSVPEAEVGMHVWPAAQADQALASLRSNDLYAAFQLPVRSTSCRYTQLIETGSLVWCQAAAPGAQPVESLFKIRPGQNTKRFVVKKPKELTRVTFDVRDERGEPCPELEVSAEFGTGGFPLFEDRRLAGELPSLSLPPGDYRFRVVPVASGAGPTPQLSPYLCEARLHALPGRHHTIRLVARAGARIRLSFRCLDSERFTESDLMLVAQRGQLPPVEINRFDVLGGEPDDVGKGCVLGVKWTFEPGRWTFHLLVKDVERATQVALLKSGSVTALRFK